MPAYAIGIIRVPQLNDAIRSYLERIDATLTPFGGRFLIHGGGPYRCLEGDPGADLIVIEFADMDHATRWYDSAAYQAIKPLRTGHSAGTVFLADGVPPGYRATEILDHA